MEGFNILVVEDEVLIADTIERYLKKKNHQVTGKAISYEEACSLYEQTAPDLVLLDIRLSGTRTGIDVAHFIQKQSKPKPYIFLTSQMDSHNINAAKETFPAGYLSKPIQKETLFATIEIAMHSHLADKDEKKTITVSNKGENHLIQIDDILYLEADHVYTKIHLKNRPHAMQRCSLKEMIDSLPANQFMQTHRSFAVNLKQVKRWDNADIFLEGNSIPLSRSRRQEVLNALERL